MYLREVRREDSAAPRYDIEWGTREISTADHIHSRPAWQYRDNEKQS